MSKALLLYSNALLVAWLQSGEQALQDADVDTASAALIQAKRLLPQAPALTEGLSAALAAVQAPIAEACGRGRRLLQQTKNRYKKNQLRRVSRCRKCNRVLPSLRLSCKRRQRRLCVAPLKRVF